MKSQLLINGFLPDATKYARALQTFLKKSNGLEPETAIVLYPADQLPQELCTLLPVARYTVVQMDCWQSEAVLDTLASLIEPDTICVLGSDSISNELAVRLGARMGGCGMMSVSGVSWDGVHLNMRRAVYTGHMEAVFETELLPCFLSIAPVGAFVDVASYSPELQKVIRVAVSADTPQPVLPAQSEGLEDASLLVIAGRGLGSAEMTTRAKQLADALSAGFGATKAVASLGWAPMSRIVGISGVITRPERCIVLGASGAPAFYAGIAAGKEILAVNLDPEAPVMSGADKVIHCDCAVLVKEALKQLSKEKEKRTNVNTDHTA